MKWIGQHIWDFISRFRSDVYLENVTESAQDHVVGIDANGKLYKQDVSTGDITGVDITVGTGLDISQSNTTSGDYTSTIDLDLTEVIASDGANRVLTSDGDGTLTAESSITFNGTSFALIGDIDMTTATGIVIASTSTTADIFDVTANSLTTGDAIEITANSITTGSFMNLSQTDTSTASANQSGLLRASYVKSGVTGDGNTKSVIGSYITMLDVATNHANATNTLTGLNVTTAFTNNAGTTKTEGINIVTTGGDTNTGLTTKVTDGGTDIKCMSSADTGDYFSISTTTHGATTLATVDDDATAAHLTLNANGDIILDSDSGVIKTGSTTFVNNSGVIQVATQGTIDHDSLANFVANEHIDWTGASAGTIHATNYTNTTYTSSDFDHDALTNFVANEHLRWDNDVSGTATIHTNNITDLHGAGVDGSANQLLTDDGDGTMTSEANLTWDGDDFTIRSASSSRPKLIIENTTVDSKPSNLSFYKNRAVGNGTDDDIIGKITFDGKDHNGAAQQYALIQAQIVESNHTDEAGLMELKVNASNGVASGERTFLKGTGSASDMDVDVEIGFGSTSMTTVAGDLTVTGSTTGKQYQVFPTNFVDDLNTSEVFLPLHGTTFEQSTVYQDDVAIVAPCDGRVVSVAISPMSLTGSGNLTVKVYTIGPNNSGTSLASWTEEESETLAFTSSDDNHVFHFAFSNAKHFESTEKIALSIQGSVDPGSNSFWYATTVIEWDYSTLLGGTSAEYDAAP